MTLRHAILRTAFACFAVSSFLPAIARAQFAEPPDQPLIAREEPREPTGDRYVAEPDSPFYAPRSTLRLHVGPALRVSEDDPDGVLFA